LGFSSESLSHRRETAADPLAHDGLRAPQLLGDLHVAAVVDDRAVTASRWSSGSSASAINAARPASPPATRSIRSRSSSSSTTGSIRSFRRGLASTRPRLRLLASLCCAIPDSHALAGAPPGS
jgi:hypothetical protein